MKRRAAHVLTAALVLQAGAFALDIALVPQASVGLVYVGTLLFAFWLPWRRAILFLAAAASVWVLLGAAVSLAIAPAEAFAILFGRGLAVVLVWATALTAVMSGTAGTAWVRSEIALRQALGAAGLGFFQLARVAGSHTIVSDEAAELLGLADSAETLDLATFPARFVHLEDRKRVERELAAILDSKQRFQSEFRVARPDGTIRYVVCKGKPVFDSRGRAIAVAATLLDVTARGNAETALREREARLRSILDTAPEALITIDERGLIESFSKSAEALFGHKSAEVVGGNVKILMPDQDRAAHDSYLDRYHKTGERRIIGIGRIVEGRRKDGTTFPMELAVGEAVANGRLLFTGFIRDLTSRHRMEQELRQSQKMEAVGQLTGGIAHDFNNLLTVMVGNLEMLEPRLGPDETKRALLKEVQEAAALGAQLTERLLAFGRRQPLNPKLTDVGTLVNEFTELLRRTLGEHIHVRTVVDGRKLAAVVDPSQLQNALLNLGINARDAMPQGGKLTIEVSRAELDLDHRRIYPDMRAGRYVLVTVTDTGCGMTLEVRERAFEPFFTTKEVGSGTGLGLSQVYGFAKQSRGHVQLYSEVGYGTSVRLFLPAADDIAADDSRMAPAGNAANRAEGETILVVEDDPRVRRVTVGRLRELGYEVLEAENGTAALDLFRRRAGIDLVFTDMVMPGGMNGGDLAAATRTLRPDVKILFTSGYAEPDLLRQPVVEGSHWLKKPYTTRELARKLRDVLDEIKRPGLGRDRRLDE